MKRLLLIICLLPVLAYGQFSGAKKLLLQQGEYCQYGNLANYTISAGGFYTFYFDICQDFAKVQSLSDCRTVIDNVRSGCVLTTGANGALGRTDDLTVGHYVLDVTSDIVQCELRFNSVDNWFIGTNYSSGAIGTVLIMEIEYGIITYIEYY